MSRIVTLGSALEDIYLIDRDDFGSIEYQQKSMFKSLEIGSKYDMDKIDFFIGGGGTNSAVTLARSGHEVIYFGNIGHDPAGEAVLKLLDEEGIDSSYVNFLPRLKTGTSIILLDSKTGNRTVLTYRGASSKFQNLSSSDLEYISPDWLYITTLRGDMGTILDFLETAKKLGTKVMFNPGELELKNSKQLLGLFQDVDVLLLNKQEAALLVGGTLLSEQLERLKNYVKTVIITDGPMGGIATNGEKTYRFGIYEDVKTVDSTGAGDAFGSGFLAAYAKGRTFKQALIFASANSTSTIQHRGAKNGILSGDIDLHPMPIQLIK